MCNGACLTFIQEELSEADIRGKRVLEVGAGNVNGTPSDHIKKYEPSEYVATDIHWGLTVTKLCNVYSLIHEFGINSFDVVVSTEMLEHVADWREAIRNLKGVVNVGGHLIITTRSKGFGYHKYPEDHFRFEVEDMNKIFADFDIVRIIKDKDEAGVLVHVKKSEQYTEIDLVDIELYNINSDKRHL